jgi:DNA-binding MarR family transcriptional regulator
VDNTDSKDLRPGAQCIWCHTSSRSSRRAAPKFNNLRIAKDYESRDLQCCRNYPMAFPANSPDSPIPKLRNYQITKLPDFPITRLPITQIQVLARYDEVRYNHLRHMPDDPEVIALLPLPPAFLHILIAIGDEERHGYAIMQDVADRTDGRVRMSPGTLYGSIRRMLDEGLIEERFPHVASDDDERRRYYRVTKFGRAVAAAEADRLSTLVRQARVSGLVPRRS